MAPSALLDAKEFESYKPLIDPRREAKPCIISGRNFIFDSDGPRSYFGSVFFNWYQFDLNTRCNIKEFRVNNRFFYGTPTGIYEVDPISLNVNLLLPIVTLKKFWPWSFAQVGNLFYFAQHEIGLWQFNDLTGVWKFIATPEPVKSVCLAYGRLVCLGRDTVFWSSLDNGTDFIPSLATGAGFQVLSILSKNAFRVDPVADGVIVATALGLIKGEFVAASYIFRWYVASRDIFMWSPNMAVVIPDVGVLYADQHGFHMNGGSPQQAWATGSSTQVWEDEMGSFLMNTYFTRLDRRLLGGCQLVWSRIAQQLFVSFAPNKMEGIYQRTFVYNGASQKWGEFNDSHRGIFEVIEQPYGLDQAAFMDLDGYMRVFKTPKDREVFCDGVSLGDVLVRLDNEPDVRVSVDEEGVKIYTGITEIHLTPDEPVLLVPEAIITQSGLYTSVGAGGSTTEPIVYVIEEKGVYFDGNTHAELTMRWSDTGFFNLSMWFRDLVNAGDGYAIVLVQDPVDGYYGWVEINHNGGTDTDMDFRLSNSNYDNVRGGTNNIVGGGNKHHLLIAVESNHANPDKKIKIFVDGVENISFSGSSSTALLPFLNDIPLWLFQDGYGGAVKGDVFDLWVDTSATLFTGSTVDSTTIEKFRTSDGERVFLGNEGQIPQGRAPLIFCSGGADTFPINRGIGGPLTWFGDALVDAVD